MADSEQTFEDALARLEEVAEQLDAGKLPLDERLALYEEGMKLVRECNRQLTEVQGKLEVLIKDGSEVSTEPLEL
ncbi:MAG: exodeoxyribonuclease VII small subunit [Armatimonadetes bacterium]|nr:exodeoxyribonuclease VII small subunit [Armatimonadota bacterium]